MLGAYLACMLYADTTYSIQTLNGTYHAANHLDAIWIIGSFVLTAGLLHPSAPQLVNSSAVVTPDATPVRLAILAVAALLAPATLTVQQALSRRPHVVVAGPAA